MPEGFSILLPLARPLQDVAVLSDRSGVQWLSKLFPGFYPDLLLELRNLGNLSHPLLVQETEIFFPSRRQVSWIHITLLLNISNGFQIAGILEFKAALIPVEIFLYKAEFKLSSLSAVFTTSSSGSSLSGLQVGWGLVSFFFFSYPSFYLCPKILQGQKVSTRF